MRSHLADAANKVLQVIRHALEATRFEKTETIRLAYNADKKDSRKKGCVVYVENADTLDEKVWRESTFEKNISNLNTQYLATLSVACDSGLCIAQFRRAAKDYPYRLQWELKPPKRDGPHQNRDVSAKRMSFSKYSGKWYGGHLTKSSGIGGPIVSGHTYDLTASDDGTISGTVMDVVCEEGMERKREYRIEGQPIGKALCLTLLDEIDQGNFAVQVLFPPLDASGEMFGIIAGCAYDWRVTPFVSPIIMSRDQNLIERNAFREALIRLKDDQALSMFCPRGMAKFF